MRSDRRESDRPPRQNIVVPLPLIRTDDRRVRQRFRIPSGFTAFDREWLTQSIPILFERQVRLRPGAIAARFGDAEISYLQLNAAANRAARHLLTATPTGPAPVALMLDQGLPLVVWILGILKAGLAYVPLDARLPASALAHMLENLGPRALVTAASHRRHADDLAGGRFPVLDVSAELNEDDGDLGIAIDADALAYVFYTSGSTGAPKGVADSHRNVLHNIMRYTNSLGFAPSDRMSLVQNPSFSGTVSSLFGALLNGATSVLQDLQSPAAPSLGSWLRRERITVFHGVPAIFRQIAPSADRYPDLRLIRLEGDRASASDLECFKTRFDPGCVLVNGLGATECGLVRQFFAGAATPAPSDGALPIGFHVSDMSIQLLDEDGRPAPLDGIGEIAVESRFLALGYWNNATLTSQRFEARADGFRRYRTGDLGKLDDQGCLTHLGRRDHQPKIAGAFVDTGELERVLQTLPGINQAVIHFQPTGAGDHRLVAYLVADGSNGRPPSVEEIRCQVQSRIAANMVPSAFVYLDTLPVTADGKLDRRLLPKPGRQRPMLAVPYAAPANPAQTRLCQIWSEVLELDAPGVDDPFLDLGGDSIGASRILARVVESDFPGFITATIVELFEHRTIRSFAAALHDRASTGVQEAAAMHPKRDRAPSHSPDHAIAIVGMAARFPGAPDIASFWDNLRQGVESITHFPASPSPGSDGLIAARGVLADVDLFDAAFFGLTPRQAKALDPQQRIWLECVHRAFEDASFSPRGPAGARVGVYVGGRESTYLWHCLGGNATAVDHLLHQDNDDAHLLRISNDTDSIATRTSFLFNLCGPSVNVQSACSTSLVAVAQACSAVAAGQCDAALAGGVCITFPQHRGYRFFAGGIQSPDGHCRAFDAAADGTVFGDGVGVVVLKRLQDARREGDRIHAVIRGWAINNDGANKASFTAPNVDAQADVIAAAHEHADVDPRHISYVEAHGTGTRVGDPIEVAGLTRAFQRRTTDRGFCALGSVKTNVGHLDTAAGIAGLIKTVLALKHREIPATLHFRRPNPTIDFPATPFFVADRLTPWESPPQSRVAGVSSFGAGGTNCHVIVGEAPARPESATPRIEPPVHPFQRQRFWYDCQPDDRDGSAPSPHEDPLLGRRIRLPGSTEIRFETRCSREWPTYLNDHRLFGVPVTPGASHFAMLAQAARFLVPEGVVTFEELYLLRPLMFPDARARHVQLVLRTQPSGWALQIVSTIAGAAEHHRDEAWTLHLMGEVRSPVVARPTPAPTLDLEQICRTATTRIPGQHFYACIWANQGGTGSSFRWIDEIWLRDGEALCHTTCPETIDSTASFFMHPGLVEAACQVLHACGRIETRDGLETDGVTFVPFSVARLSIFHPNAIRTGVWCHARLRALSNAEVVGDLTIADEHGVGLALIEGFTLRPIGRDAVTRASDTPAARSSAMAIPTSPGPLGVVDLWQYLVRQCTEISGYAEAEITPDGSFVGLGLDSLMAVMLSNRIRSDLGVPIGVGEILSSASFAALADTIRIALPPSS